MKKWWVLLAIFAAIVILVVMIPARAYRLVLENHGTHLLATKGTIWYGSGNITAKGKNIGRLNWSFRPREIFAGKLTFKVTMQNQNIRLHGVINRGFTYTEFQGTTTLAQSLVNSILLPYEIHVEGEFEISDLSVKINDKRKVENLSGSVAWLGGTSRYRTNDETRVFEMPAVTGALSHVNGFAVLNTIDVKHEIPLIEARLQPDSGAFEIALTQQMIELSQMPWDSFTEASDIVLEVSRNLY